MKKVVLIFSALAVCLAVTAKDRLASPSKIAPGASFERKQAVADENLPKAGKQSSPNMSVARHGNQGGNSVQAVITLGTAANALTAIRTHNFVWADPTMQLVTFTHRAVGTTSGVQNSGRFFYDISHDNGATWDTTQGPIYTPSLSTVVNPSNGRYPQGAVYNPMGSNSYADAYITYYGAALNGTNLALSVSPPTDWGGNVYGAYKLDTSTPPTQHELSSDSAQGIFYVIPEALHMCKNGTTYALSESDYGNSDLMATPRGVAYDYTGQMVWQKGSWNSTTNDYDYSQSMLGVPAGELPYNRWYAHPYAGGSPNTDPVSTMLGSNIVFNDNGQIGYMVCKMFRNNWESPDTSALFYVFKTTDGGANWVPTITPDFDGADSLCADSGFSMGIFGQTFDVMIDANDNLHIITGIGTDYMSELYGTSQTYYEVYGSMFDVYTIDGGSIWKAHRLKTDPIHEVYGVMGDPATAADRQTYDNRPQITRSHDGTKLFFSWFETDTIAWPPVAANLGYNNQHPDMHVVGYDVTTNMWTPEMNATAFPALNGDADGACLMGSVSYYALDNGSGGHKIPLVIALNQETSTNNNPDWERPFTFKYVDGVEITSGSYTVAPGASNDVFLNVLTGTNNARLDDEFLVSPVRPNPVTESADLLVQIAKPGSVTVDVRNVLGQVVSSTEYSNQTSGAHQYTINASDLRSGIYMCTVTYNGMQHTQKITIQ